VKQAMELERAAISRRESQGSALARIRTPAAESEWLDATVRRFAQYLEADGLHAALGYLNSRTRFRFTGAYRFAPPLLCSIGVFDRENPALILSAEVPMETTYCSIVAAERGSFVVDDSGHDPRVVTHPSRDIYAAYCGVPLRDAAGEPFGTLCHFDPRPRIGSADQTVVLDRVAPLVASYSLGLAN
jgi:GAF domain-containing protein